jgi:hypothetical protein
LDSATPANAMLLRELHHSRRAALHIAATHADPHPAAAMSDESAVLTMA